MKKALKLTALCLVLVLAVATLASCGGPSGKYTASSFLGTTTTLDFDGDNVTVSISVPVVGEVFSKTTTYEIKDDQITFDFADEENVENALAKAVIETFEQPVSYEKVDNGIKIGGTTFTKAD